MNKALAMFVLTASLALLAGCSGGEKPEASPDAGSAAPSASAPAAGGATLPPGLDEGPRAAESPVDEAKAAEGEKLFSTKGCTACHAFGKKVTGPDMAGVSKRRTAKWIEAQILHPDLMVKQDPIARELFAKHALQMPKQGLTPEQAAAVIEYFKLKDR